MEFVYQNKQDRFVKTSIRITLTTLITLAALALLGYYISLHEIPVLQPKGMIGIKERNILATCTLLMLIVVVPVFILTLYFGWKYRDTHEKGKYEPTYEHNNIAECCWWGVPLIIIIVISVITWRSSHELNPFKPIDTEKQSMDVQVVALDWKWLFIYPDQGIASVNYLKIPKDVPIDFQITSDAPMNSFWIPQLGGMIMAMPGMRSQLHLMADAQGLYSGRSAQISGKGFAGMVFTAEATSQEDFEKWVAEVRSSPKQLTLDEYNRLVEPSEYDPVVYYQLQKQDLFDYVLMKYLVPEANNKQLGP